MRWDFSWMGVLVWRKVGDIAQAEGRGSVGRQLAWMCDWNGGWLTTVGQQPSVCRTSCCGWCFPWNYNVGLTELRALTCCWLVSDSTAPCEIWRFPHEIWPAGFIDLGKRSQGCFFLQLDRPGLLIAKCILRSQDWSCCKAVWLRVPCTLFKGFVNRFSASEGCSEGSPVQAAPWTWAHVATVCVGLCSRKQNVMLVILFILLSSSASEREAWQCSRCLILFSFKPLNILVWRVLLIFPDLHDFPADPGFLEKDVLDNAAPPLVPNILRLFPTSQTHPAGFRLWLALFIVSFTSAPLLKPNLVLLSLASWQVWILQICPGSEEKQLFKDLEFNWEPKGNTAFHSG